MNIGFSTGSLAFGDFRRGIEMQKDCSANAIELSALRENELEQLVNALGHLNLSQFKYISFHAPSKLHTMSEEGLIEKLLIVAKFSYNIIVHPDIIEDFSKWRVFGPLLCIENMDKRKPIGQTVSDLCDIFHELPEASLCFDIAHAKQVDPTLLEAIAIAKTFKGKIRELHVSDVNSNSEHEPLNLESILAFRKLKKYLDSTVPIILESPVAFNQIEFEIGLAHLIFDDKIYREYMSRLNLQPEALASITE